MQEPFIHSFVLFISPSPSRKKEVGDPCHDVCYQWPWGKEEEKGRAKGGGTHN